ncbi:MAG: two-component system, LuxR family, sensor kinase FixL [Campylobacterota bacterium]|nr:two-component system, LuxR family, sensor kinase FixL [Campylobacterota bacterium]
MQEGKIRYFFKKVYIFWAILIFGSLALEIYIEYSYVEKTVLNEAQSNVKKDFMFRNWIASHGGVYAPVTEQTPSNKYLLNIPERDIETPSGKKLTLMNPAYALSHMMKYYSQTNEIKGRTVSLGFVNPENEPDAWEKEQLKILEKTKKPFYEITVLDNKRHLRYISPMMVTHECMQCHANHKIGDVRGGISISIPTQKYYEEFYSRMLLFIVFHIVILIIGFLAIKITLLQTIKWAKENSDYKNKLREANQDLEKKVQEAISELRSKDDILMKQSKNAAMGEMIANIAHQWRQPLDSLGLTIQDIAEAQEYGELTPEYIDKTVKKSMSIIYKMSDTINDFGNFFKPDKEATQFFIFDVISEVKEIVGSSLKNKGIALEITGEKDMRIFGYKNEFSHALLNIISNAKDAFENLKEKAGKKITIAIEKNQENVILKIRDNAGGIPRDIIDKIFEPYFTTKEKTNGTGIGLYMSKTIIEKNMGGELSASNIEDGAEFTIAIPSVNNNH